MEKIVFPNLQQCHGDIEISSEKEIAYIHFPLLMQAYSITINNVIYANFSQCRYLQDKQSECGDLMVNNAEDDEENDSVVPYKTSTHINMPCLEKVGSLYFENTSELFFPKVKNIHELFSPNTESCNMDSLEYCGTGRDFGPGFFVLPSIKELSLPSLKKVYICLDIPLATSFYAPNFEYIGKNLNAHSLKNVDLPALKYVQQHLKMSVAESVNMPSLQYVGGNFEAPKLSCESHLESLKKVRMSFRVGSVKCISFAQNSAVEIASLGSMSCYEISSDKDIIREYLIDLDTSGAIYKNILKTLAQMFVFTNPYGGLKTDFELGAADLSGIELGEKYVELFREGITTPTVKIQRGNGLAMNVTGSKNGVLEGNGAFIDSRDLHIFVVDENKNIFKGKIEEISDKETKKKCYIIE